MEVRRLATTGALLLTATLFCALALQVPAAGRDPGRTHAQPRPPEAPSAAKEVVTPIVDAHFLAAGFVPPGACAVEDNDFRTEDGGCKDLQTGIVWSAYSLSLNPPMTFTWEEAIAYCDDLVEGGPTTTPVSSRSTSPIRGR